MGDISGPVRVVSSAQARTHEISELSNGFANPAEVALRRALTPRQRFLKRLLDLALTIPGIVVLSPLFVLVAVALYLDSGWPVIHRQVRVGGGGRIFAMYKFRTMVPERRRKQVPFKSPDRRSSHKTKQDPRITRGGHFLRRTSLDELPQLFNVLLGNMTLVGPRPELPSIVKSYEPWQWERFGVPPGITGLWQIRGRSLRPLMCQDDIEYIKGYSLWLDVKILVQTVIPVITGRGAF